MQRTGSAISCFKASGALILEDLRRYKALILMAYIAYFITGPCKILMDFSEIDKIGSGNTDYRVTLTHELAEFVNMLLSGAFPVYTLLFLAVPITAAVMVFGYLHKPGYVVSVHSQPFNRCTLAHSHALSALVICAAPIILNGITMLVIMRPLYAQVYSLSSTMEFINNIGTQEYNVFTPDRVFGWIVTALVITLFVLAICVFSAVITGTQQHQIIASLGFNFLLNVLGVLIFFYYSMYVFGFTSRIMAEVIMPYASPITAVYSGFASVYIYNMAGGDLQFGGLSAQLAVLYTIAALAIYGFSVFLYTRRKLERAGKGVVFKAMDIIITAIFGFIGMTILGVMFYINSDESETFAIIGHAAGAVLGIIICRMILEKSFKVFNRSTIKLTGIFAVCAAVFVGCIKLDVTGFERYVPEDFDGVLYVGHLDMDPESDASGEYNTPEDMEHVKNIHRFIIDNKDKIKSYVKGGKREGIYPEGYGTVMFDYYYYVNKENGNNRDNYPDGSNIARSVQRIYEVPFYLMYECEDLKDLISSNNNSQQQ